MKYIRLLGFFLVGILFGITMTKAEIISWYRIQEMFRFQAFHMYGIIGSALGLGMLVVAIIKKYKLTSLNGHFISFQDKNKSISRYLFGGIVFGLGWALVGACPGPIYVLIGNGFSIFIVVLLSALLGTFTYGLFRDYLPH